MRKPVEKDHPRRVQEAEIAIGERVQGRRNQLGMSQGELRKILGVSFQQIQKYEKGGNRISSGRLLQLAAGLECNVTDLLGGGVKGSTRSSPFSSYAASKEGVAIINAMQKIASPAVRRRIIELAETLSGSMTP